MTAIQARPPSKMVELGQVITAIQGTRHTDYQVADFIGASVKLYDQWKAGELVPDNQRWSRMCQMMRDLRPYRGLWQEALAELAHKDQTRPLVTNLGSKLANIKIVADPEPAPAPTPVAQEPEATKARPEGFTVANLPAGWRLPENVAAREEYARAMVRENPEITTAEIREAQTKEFGVATASKRMNEVIEDELAKVAKAKKRAETKAARDADPYAYQRTQERKEAKAKKAPSLQDNVTAATELLLEAIPNLSTFTLTVGSDGATKVEFKTRKVVEEEGSIVLRGKK